MLGDCGVCKNCPNSLVRRLGRVCLGVFTGSRDEISGVGKRQDRNVIIASSYSSSSLSHRLFLCIGGDRISVEAFHLKRRPLPSEQFNLGLKGPEVDPFGRSFILKSKTVNTDQQVSTSN